MNAIGVRDTFLRTFAHGGGTLATGPDGAGKPLESVSPGRAGASHAGEGRWTQALRSRIPLASRHRAGDASGLVRKRLTSRLLDPGAYLVARVVAPAGSGKSRLLAHVAASYPGPVAWCGAPEPVPRTEQALAQWLWNGVGPALERGRPATH